MADVATTKLFENDDVIVWDFRLAPGESTGVHTHTLPYFFRVLVGSTLEVFDGDGASLGEIEFVTGAVHSLSLDGDELVPARGPRVAATHSATNVGDADYHEILVELKG